MRERAKSGARTEKATLDSRRSPGGKEQTARSPDKKHHCSVANPGFNNAYLQLSIRHCMKNWLVITVKARINSHTCTMHICEKQML